MCEIPRNRKGNPRQDSCLERTKKTGTPQSMGYTHTHTPVTHTLLLHKHTSHTDIQTDTITHPTKLSPTHIPVIHTHTCYTQLSHTHTPLHTHTHTNMSQTHRHLSHTHTCYRHTPVTHKHTAVTHRNTHSCYTHTLLSYTHIHTGIQTHTHTHTHTRTHTHCVVLCLAGSPGLCLCRHEIGRASCRERV